MMDRRALLASGLALPIAGLAVPASARPRMRTQWRLDQSEGLDALVFLGPLTGAAIHTQFYGVDVADFRSKLPAARLADLDAMGREASDAKRLVGPTLVTVASGAEDRSIEAVLRSFGDPDRFLKAKFEASPYASSETWDQVIRWAPRVVDIIPALQDAGFSAWRTERLAPRIQRRTPELQASLDRLDVIAEQERLLGTPLGAEIEVCLMLCVAPFGIKVQGQRFLIHAGYPESKIILTACHEILHPPLRPGSRAEAALLDLLRPDPLLQRVVRDHNPAFGYNSIEGLANEDLVEALDQIVQDRLGVVDRPPAQRWTEDADGMHILAAGLYGFMRSEGYDQTGGVLEDWILQGAADGRLNVDRLHREASALLGRNVHDWTPPAPA